MTDNVNHPAHYETGKFECIDVMLETQGVEAVLNFCQCNAFKYLYRAKRKNGLEDMKKAVWYLNKYIELKEGHNYDETALWVSVVNPASVWTWLRNTASKVTSWTKLTSQKSWAMWRGISQLPPTLSATTSRRCCR